MNDHVKSINGLDEWMRDGDDPPQFYPLEQVYNEPIRQQFKTQSEFMRGFEECFDSCSAVACILIFGPFLLMLGIVSLPILIPYSIVYLVKKFRCHPNADTGKKP